MTASLILQPRFRAFDADGAPLAQGTLRADAAGTDTLKDTWKDKNKSVLNTNPISLDDQGYADVWGDGSYKFTLKDATGASIYVKDNIDIYQSLDWSGLTATVTQINACDTSAIYTGNANYTVLAANRGKTICADNSINNIDITLPNPSLIENGFLIRIKKTDLSAFSVTIDAGVGYTIDGFYRYHYLYGTSTSIWLLWTGVDWQIVQQGNRRNYATFTASGNVETYMDNYLIKCNIGAANITLTLPLFAAIGFGFHLTIKLCSSGGGGVLIDPGAGGSIDTIGSYLLGSVDEVITIWCDNESAGPVTNWFIKSSHNPTAFVSAGIIVAYGSNVVLAGWLACDGAAISRTTYSDLFSIIGTTFGVGDGSTTFNVPNGEDNVLVGAGGAYTMAQTFGSVTHQLTVPELASHNHSITGNVAQTADTCYANPGGLHRSQGTSLTIGNTGGNVPHENRQPSLCVQRMIKY